MPPCSACRFIPTAGGYAIVVGLIFLERALDKPVLALKRAIKKPFIDYHSNVLEQKRQVRELHNKLGFIETKLIGLLTRIELGKLERNLRMM